MATSSLTRSRAVSKRSPVMRQRRRVRSAKRRRRGGALKADRKHGCAACTGRHRTAVALARRERRGPRPPLRGGRWAWMPPARGRYLRHCEEHHPVTVQQMALTVTAETESIGVVRHFVTSPVCHFLGTDAPDMEVVALLTSELTANVVDLGVGSEVVVTVRCIKGRLRVEVHDFGYGMPQVLHPGAVDQGGGRGLMIVDQLADDWGVDQFLPGKIVWFEMASTVRSGEPLDRRVPESPEDLRRPKRLDSPTPPSRPRRPGPVPGSLNRERKPLPRWLARIDAWQRDPWSAVVPGGGLPQVRRRPGSAAVGVLIAHYAFFSIFPLLLVLVTVIGWVLSDHPALRQEVIDSTVAQFPVIGSRPDGATSVRSKAAASPWPSAWSPCCGPVSAWASGCSTRSTPSGRFPGWSSSTAGGRGGFEPWARWSILGRRTGGRTRAPLASSAASAGSLPSAGSAWQSWRSLSWPPPSSALFRGADAKPTVVSTLWVERWWRRWAGPSCR